MDHPIGNIFDRRSFLRATATVGAGVLVFSAAGNIGALLPGSNGQDATGLAPHSPGSRNRPARELLGTLDPTGVVTRIGILSDAHYCDTDNAASDKLSRALATLGWVAPDIDAFFMLGDLTLNGYDQELELFALETSHNLLANYAPEVQMHLIMGNHDYWNCTEEHFESFFTTHDYALLFPAEQNSVAFLAGATIIKLNGTGGVEVDMMDYTGAYDFLAEALAEAAANRPDDAILIMTHEPPEGLELPTELEHGYYGQNTSLDMIALIAQYPQARMFSGHIHNPLDLRETVNQELGFTSVHTSTVGSCFFIRGEQVDRDESGSHGLILDIMEDGRVLLHRLDFASQEYIGEPVLL